MGQRSSHLKLTGRRTMNTQEVTQSEDEPTQLLQVEVSEWNHECEWTAEVDAEADLHLHYNNCKKNPGHTNFIPIGQFNIDHLPPHFRDKDIVKWTNLTAHLTVKLLIRCVSKNRPFPQVRKPYPFSRFRGSGMLRSGTGFVSGVTRYKGRCECEINCPRKDGGKVWVKTACHVIYDNLEAEKTQIIFYYDSEEHVNLARVELPRGVGECSDKMDECSVYFYCHDVEFLDKLEDTLKRKKFLEEKLYDKYIFPKRVNFPGSKFQYKSPAPPFPVIIVSHPHGCAKMVSIGNLMEEKIYTVAIPSFFYIPATTYLVYDYTTNTCPGSSGAPVFGLGAGWRKLTFSAAAPHSQHVKDGLNRSAAQWR